MPDKTVRILPDIFLGFPFDQLMDQECPLTATARADERPDVATSAGTRKYLANECHPGILRPTTSSPGTGNIVICGPPGSGKSTLAMQFAVVAATRDENKSVTAYVSLECSVDEVLQKAEPFGWRDGFHPIQHLHNVSDFSSRKDLATFLRLVLAQKTAIKTQKCAFFQSGREDKTPVHCDKYCGDNKPSPCVLLPSLSPRPIVSSEDAEGLFWTRYHQLENLLAAAQELESNRDDYGVPREQVHSILPVVVVDSLNMFSTRPLQREELYRLLHLFRQHRTIGIFVVETGQPVPFDSTMADTVITLSTTKEHGHYLRHLEIEKSRYVHGVYGRHPFKIRPCPEGRQPSGRDDAAADRTPQILPENDAARHTDEPRRGIVVFPSLHYVVSKTHSRKNNDNAGDETMAARSGKPATGDETMAARSGKPATGDETMAARSEKPATGDGARGIGEELFGIEAFNSILPVNLKRPAVVMIEGPRNTFKTAFAQNALAKGFASGESVLLLRLKEGPLLRYGDVVNRVATNAARLSKEMREFRWDSLINADIDPEWQWRNLSEPAKADIHVLKDAKAAGEDPPLVFEIDFATGALLPEEFVQIVRDILIRCRPGSIRRVVLDDVSQIGVSYPFLRHSSTADNLFLPSLVHITRHYGIDLIMTGTTGHLAEADEAVNRASSLSDAVISCRFQDIFGDRHVVVRGEGLMASKGTQAHETGESVPGVVHLSEADGISLFDVDIEHLEGLVGFETGRVHRPGLAVHLFEEDGKIHKGYNNEIRAMLGAAMAAPAVPPPTLGACSGERRRIPSTGVSVVTFNARMSEAFHDSLGVLRGAPIEKTLLCTVDEFWHTKDEARRFLPLSFDEKESGEERLDKNDLVEEARQRLNKDGESVYAWPYYLNVLLLAYRHVDGQNQDFEPNSWKQVHALSRGLFDTAKNDPAAPVMRAFWYDHSAPETLSCTLMDALAATKPWAPDPIKAFRDLREKATSLATEELHELQALVQLFHSIGSRPRKDINRLPNDSAVYLCWYSQLRDLIHREPSLAERLSVCRLPGGGFTGDWFVGIVNGSVSRALGQRIIKILCRKEEEHKRFARGVGLPTRRAFYENEVFRAWPRASRVPVDKLLRIHREAHSRADIAGYRKFRSVIATRAERLGPPTGIGATKESEKSIERGLNDEIKRLFDQIDAIGCVEP